MKSLNERPQSGFPARFQEFLTAFKLNPNKLAVELNDKNPVKFRRWVAGETNPSYDVLLLIADQYEVDVNWFMFGTGEMKRTATVDQLAATTGNHSSAASQLTSEKNKALIDENAKLLGMLADRDKHITEQNAKIDGLQRRVEELYQKIVVLLNPELSFLKASDRTPGPTSRRRYFTPALRGPQPHYQEIGFKQQRLGK